MNLLKPQFNYTLVVSQKGWVGAGGGEYPEFINPFSAYFILKKITLVYPEYVEYISRGIFIEKINKFE